MPRTTEHPWRFKARFRRHAFGWRSQPAITRLEEAVSEIKQVARVDPVVDGAVLLLERISPALENVDSSSGAIGPAVNRTIGELVPVIAVAPADTPTRTARLERLFRRALGRPDSVHRTARRILGRAVRVHGRRL